MMKKKLRVENFKGQNYKTIKKQLIDRNSEFTDVIFPANLSSLGMDTEVAKSVEWKRPYSLCDNPQLFDPQSHSTKVQSGQLSSSNIISAFCILSGIKELCYKIVINYLDQEYDCDKARIGIFVFRFWRFGRWTDVVVDDFLPTVKGKLICTHSLNMSEFWVSLTEKAYAKLNGSYDALKECSVADVLVDLTGGVSEVIDLKSRNYGSSDDKRSEFFHSLSADMSVHSIICVSVLNTGKDSQEIRNELGLVPGQQYLITAVKNIHLEEVSLRNLFMGREKVAVVRLRDVCYKKLRSNNSNALKSNYDDNFAFSTSSLTKLLSKNPLWTKLKESDKDRLGLIVHHEGEFWMPFEDFVVSFDELTVVRLFNNNFFTSVKKWSETLIKSAWTIGNRDSSKDRSGGGNVNTSSFLKNPQFLLHIRDKEEEIVLQMLQWDGVEAKLPAGANSQHPETQHGILLIGLFIIKVEVNRKYRLHKLTPFTKLLVSVNHQRKRELYYSAFFPKGNYMLVPTTLKEGAEGKFLMRAISHGNFHLSEIRLDGPKRAKTCFSGTHVWVTAISVQSAVGLNPPKNIFFVLKCEKQKVKSQISKYDKETKWEDSYVFYRKKPSVPIVIKVYRHHPLRQDKFIGWAELPASLNHSASYLDVVLLTKDKTQIRGVTIGVKILTEDNFTAI